MMTQTCSNKNSQQTKQTFQKESGDVLNDGLKRSGRPLKAKTVDINSSQTLDSKSGGKE